MANQDYKLIKLGQIVSPKGTAKSAFVVTASKKFKEEGEYSVRLLFEKNDVTKKFMEELKGKLKEAVAQQKAAHPELSGKLVSKDDMSFGTDEDGNYFISAKQSAIINVKGEKKHITLPIRDGKRELMDREGLDISKGSILKLALDVMAYVNPKKLIGISLKLREIMCLKAVSFEYSSAFGEDDEEEFEDFEVEAEDDGGTVEDPDPKNDKVDLEDFDV
jgi:hypothetical protein